jgi:hypothetical protein
MADILKEIEDAGRSTDNVVGHLTNGEIVIPVQLAEIPEVKKAIKAIFQEYGVSLNEFTVGNSENKINPETGYPEFFFSKIFKSIGKGVSNAVKSVGKVFTGKSQPKKKEEPKKTTTPTQKSAAPVTQKTLDQDQKKFDQTLVDLKKKDDDARIKAEQDAKDQAIAAESTRARGLAGANQQEIATQLSQSLSKPLNQDVPATPMSYSPSGYGSDKPKKAVPGAGGGPTPTETAATMPAGLLAQKINQDSGGTNMATNRFNIPNVEGLQFGGS